MKPCVFLVVRIDSTRLTKKALRKISGYSLIEILINRIIKDDKRKLIVCTTDTKNDYELVRFLKKFNVEVFRGNSKDVLQRIFDAAEIYKKKFFVLVDGDDVFCEPQLIDRTFRKLEKTNYDLIEWKNLPFGTSPIGIRTEKLERLIKLKKKSDTDTGGAEIMKKSGLFKTIQLVTNDKKLCRPDIRLSIDYPNDLKLVRKIYRKLKHDFSLIDIIKILDMNPNWLKINEHEKKLYIDHFSKKIKQWKSIT